MSSSFLQFAAQHIILQSQILRAVTTHWKSKKHMLLSLSFYCRCRIKRFSFSPECSLIQPALCHHNRKCLRWEVRSEADPGSPASWKFTRSLKNTISSVCGRLRPAEAIVANWRQCWSFRPFLSFVFWFSGWLYQLLSSLQMHGIPRLAFKLWGMDQCDSEWEGGDPMMSTRENGGCYQPGEAILSLPTTACFRSNEKARTFSDIDYWNPIRSHLALQPCISQSLKLTMMT